MDNRYQFGKAVKYSPQINRHPEFLDILGNVNNELLNKTVSETFRGNKIPLSKVKNVYFPQNRLS